MLIDEVGGWPTVLGILVEGEHLHRDQATVALRSVLAGEATPAQLAALIVALRINGETVDEVAGLVDAMCEVAEPLELPEGTIDIVGTGGSPQGRVRALNVSTMAAIVAAAAGASVCKHGNRKASSTCGSFDLLEELGVRIDLDGRGVARCVAEVGVGFCFARSFHPAMRHAGPVRAELGVPTVFNVLGPLSHPGRVRRQVVGVGDPRLLDLVAGVLAERGAEHALVVHGPGALDELGLDGPSATREIRDGVVVGAEPIDPQALGLAVTATADLPGGDEKVNAAITTDVFAGERGAARDIVALNAAAGLYVAGIASSVAEGLEAALAAIDSGASAKTLDALVVTSQAIGAAG